MTDHTSEPTRKPRVALMGEFSAGKSTLSNLLLDGTPFPVRVTATRLPPVWTSYGESGAVAVGYDDEETPIAPEEIADVSLDETRLIHAYQGHAVMISPLVPQWRRRIAGVFAFPASGDPTSKR